MTSIKQGQDLCKDLDWNDALTMMRRVTGEGER